MQVRFIGEPKLPLALLLPLPLTTALASELELVRERRTMSVHCSLVTMMGQMQGMRFVALEGHGNYG